MPRGTPRFSPPLSAQFLCWRKTLGEYYRERWPKAMKA